MDANEQMQVIGTNAALGNWNSSGKPSRPSTDLEEEIPIQMDRSDKNYPWLQNKFGSNVRPWNCRVLMDNKDWK